MPKVELDQELYNALRQHASDNARTITKHVNYLLRTHDGIANLMAQARGVAKMESQASTAPVSGSLRHLRKP